MKNKLIYLSQFLIVSLALGQYGSDSIQATSPTGTLFAKDASVALKLFPGANGSEPEAECCDSEGVEQAWSVRSSFQYSWGGKASGSGQTATLDTSKAGVHDVTCDRGITWDCVSGEVENTTISSTKSYTIVEVVSVSIPTGSPCPSSTQTLSHVTAPASRPVTYSIVGNANGASVSGASLTMPSAPGASVTIKAVDSAVSGAYLEKTFTNASLVTGTISVSNLQYGPTNNQTMRFDFTVTRDLAKCGQYPSNLSHPETNGQADYSAGSGNYSSPLSTLYITGSTANKSNSISNAFLPPPSNTSSGTVVSASAEAGWYVSGPSAAVGDSGSCSPQSTTYTYN